VNTVPGPVRDKTYNQGRPIMKGVIMFLGQLFVVEATLFFAINFVYANCKLGHLSLSHFWPSLIFTGKASSLPLDSTSSLAQILD